MQRSTGAGSLKIDFYQPRSSWQELRKLEVSFKDRSWRQVDEQIKWCIHEWNIKVLSVTLLKTKTLNSAQSQTPSKCEAILQSDKLRRDSICCFQTLDAVFQKGSPFRLFVHLGPRHNQPINNSRNGENQNQNWLRFKRVRSCTQSDNW